MADTDPHDWWMHAVDAVLVIHGKRTGLNDYSAPYTFQWCAECRQAWPCATVEAIEKARPDAIPRPSASEPFGTDTEARGARTD